MLLQPQERGTVLYFTHANVRENEYTDLKKGWNEYYWTPWKKYLKDGYLAKKTTGILSNRFATSILFSFF